MDRYRKRTVEVQASQVTEEDVRAIANWCGGQVVEEIHPFTQEISHGINVPTLDGPERASRGDYVVKNEHGGFFTCKEHDFVNNFEPAE